MLYDQNQIQQAIDSGQIVCHPFAPERLHGISLDITLGYYYYRLADQFERSVYNAFSHADVTEYFEGPYQALPHQEWCKRSGLQPLEGVPADHPVIVLGPGERILAHSHEFIGIRPPDICSAHGRSRWVRNGLAIGLDSTWVEQGTLNRITFELYNFNRHSLVLPVGESIGQIVFHKVGEHAADQESHLPDLETIIKTWTPSQMLPRTYQSERKLPPKIEGTPYA